MHSNRKYQVLEISLIYTTVNCISDFGPEGMKLVGRTYDLWLKTNRTFEGNLLAGALLVEKRMVTEKMRGECREERTRK